MVPNRGTFEVVQLILGGASKPPTSLKPIIKELDRNKELAVNVVVDYLEDGELKAIVAEVALKVSRHDLAFGVAGTDMTGHLLEERGVLKVRIS